MRNFFGALGVACGAVVVVLVARYGYKTTDVAIDAWIMAFLFAVIATFGLAGHAFSVFLWRHSKTAALIAGVVAFLALGLNLSNSLAAIAGRQDVAELGRIERNRLIRTTDAELKRQVSLLQALPPFATGSEEVVAAAKRAAEVAGKVREGECGNGDPRFRGRLCRDREADEKQALESLSKAGANWSLTQRAAKAEREVEALRKRLDELGPEVRLSAQGATLARLFRMPESEAGFTAVMQQLGIAAIVELIILVTLIGWEVSRPQFQPQAPQVAVEVTSAKPLAAAPLAVESAPVPEEIMPPVPSPFEYKRPAKPRLIATPTRPVAAVEDFLAQGLMLKKGPKTELTDVVLGYGQWCKRKGLKPTSIETFVDELEALCSTVGIRIERSEQHSYLLDVSLAA